MSPEEARRILAEADLICPAEEINRALDRLAVKSAAAWGTPIPWC